MQPRETFGESKETLEKLVDKLSGWFDGFVLLLPNLVIAVLVLVAFWLAALGIRRGLLRLLRRISRVEQINRLLGTTVYLVVLAAGLFIALGILGLDKTVGSLLAGAGILGLALGFAFQDIAANFMSGIYMALQRPIEIGQLIETNDFFGTVEKINLRSLVLRTPEGQRVLIPNKQVFEKPIVNYSVLGKRRVDVAVGVSYGDDLAKAREVAIAAVEAVTTRDPDRPIELFFEQFGDSSINCVVRFWVPFRRQPDYLGARSEAIVKIKQAFDENGLTIPFPIRTLDFGIVGGEKLSRTLSEVDFAPRRPGPADDTVDDTTAT